MSNLAAAVFYPLDEGTGTTVSDALGNGPAGSIAGTLTNIWSNSGAFTISNGAGAAGDNAIRLQSSYIDNLMRLDNLNGSIVVMFWLKQPQPPSSGAQCSFSYGDINSNTDGGYAFYADSCGAIYSIRGGATWQARGPANAAPLTATYNNRWFAYCIQLDVIDGVVVTSAYINGYPYWGARLFNLESALPRVASSGCGARFLAAAYGQNGSGQQMWGQTQVKRLLIGRTNGDLREDVPKWAKEFYETTSGIPSFVRA